MELTNLSLFVLTSFILCLAPGPDNIYVLTQGITKGKKAAIITTLGLATGIIIHTTAATFGISVIYQTSKFAYDIVRYMGAIYLLYIAYLIFKNRAEVVNLSLETTNIDIKKLYIRGFFMNILNPKVSIFFLAFLPQFVLYEKGNVTFQMILLGVIFMLLTIIVFFSIGIMGNILKNKLLKNPNIIKNINLLTSFVLTIFSLKLLIS